MSPIYHYVFGRFLIFICGFFEKIENRHLFLHTILSDKQPKFYHLSSFLLVERIYHIRGKYARPITTPSPHGGGELSIDCVVLVTRTLYVSGLYSVGTKFDKK